MKLHVLDARLQKLTIKFMKKKLKLDALKVQSFITAPDMSNVNGGRQTLADCLTGVYPTLDPVGCADTGTNGLNCPCDVASRLACNDVSALLLHCPL